MDSEGAPTRLPVRGSVRADGTVVSRPAGRDGASRRGV